MKTQRRQFLLAASTVGIAGVVAGRVAAADAPPGGKLDEFRSLRKAYVQGVAEGNQPSGKPDEDVSPGEDLMREHGVLKRVLMVYDEMGRRLRGKEDFPPEALANSAGIIRHFIEDYHEKLEEDFLFPRFRKAQKHVELVDALQAQHQAGRKLTDRITALATAQALKSDDDRQTLRRYLRLFNRMYSVHEAREDTVLFPAFHELVTGHEYDVLGDQFEKREHDMLGADGFEKMVDRVAGIEKTLGIYDLAQFTPQI